MSLHQSLPIHRTGVALLALAIKAQEQMPRGVKRMLGDKVTGHCVEMLDLMALANATKHAERADYVRQLLAHQRAAEVLLRVSLDSRHISVKLWAQATQLLQSIGRQGGGWLKSATNKAPAA